jgi:GNAT superfamily N-acetyltransferase
VNGIRVRALLRSDLEEINELHRTRDDVAEEGAAEKRTELLEWLAFHNPFAGDEATYFVAEVDGVIAAFQGRMPLAFMVNGTRRKGYYVHDTYVHPEYRKKGLGFSLITALAQATEEQSDSFFCLLGGTPLNLKIQRRMGYLELPPAPQYVKLLNPQRQLRRLIKFTPLAALLAPLARTGLRLLDTLLLMFNNPSSTTVRSVDKFDHRIDQLVDGIGGKLGISSYKSCSYLNWKFGCRPHKRDEILIAESQGQILGFAILALTRGEGSNGGVIMDLVADPDDNESLHALLRASVKFFRKRNVDFVRYVTSNLTLGATSRRFLFLKSKEGKPVLLGNTRRAPEISPSLMDITNWNMTLAESDAFMLSP